MCGSAVAGPASTPVQPPQPQTVLPGEPEITQPWASNVLLGTQMSPAHPGNLIEDERVVLRATIHWWAAYRVSITILTLACVLTVVLQLAASDGGSVSKNAGIFMGGLFVVVALIAAIFGAIQRKATEFVVTTRRVSVKVGFVSRRSIEILLGKVEGVSVEQNPFSAALGFGTIVVHGVGGTKEPFQFVEDPQGFRARFQAQIEAASRQPSASAPVVAY